jgi:hypothetical protein
MTMAGGDLLSLPHEYRGDLARRPALRGNQSRKQTWIGRPSELGMRASCLRARREAVTTRDGALVMRSEQGLVRVG